VLSANTSKLAGTVTDATGGVLVNADVQLTTGTPPRVVASGKTNSDGAFEMNVAPGQYTLKISVPDFKDVIQQVRVTPDIAPLSITMALSITTQVNVKSSPSLGRLVASFAEPAQGGGGGGAGGGGGFGGGGGRGGGGSTVTNPNRVPTGARTLSFSIQASNFLNSATKTTINGVLSSPLYGQLTGGSPGRKVVLSMTLKLF
jgi:hypothetical protein